MTRQRPNLPGPPWLDLTVRIVERSQDLRGAACAGRGREFDGRGGPDADTTQAAIAVCRSCAALDACRQWVETTPRWRTPSGVVAARWRGDAS